MTTSPESPDKTPSRWRGRFCDGPTRLRPHPTSAAKSPKLDDELLREIPAYSWRIVYHVRDGKVFIVTLVHKRRHVEPEQLKPEP